LYYLRRLLPVVLNLVACAERISALLKSMIRATCSAFGGEVNQNMGTHWRASRVPRPFVRGELFMLERASARGYKSSPLEPIKRRRRDRFTLGALCQPSSPFNQVTKLSN
jgi:hypothetical protein